MNTLYHRCLWSFAIFIGCVAISSPAMAWQGDADGPYVPPALTPWVDWVLRSEADTVDVPRLSTELERQVNVWPGSLRLRASQSEGLWSMPVTVYANGWVPLPGDTSTWPMDVRIGDNDLPVVERENRPSVFLQPGEYTLSGRFQWTGMPQRISVPREVGILQLSVDDEAIAIPRWDTQGQVWLKRVRGQDTQKDTVTQQVYRVVEDGIPTRLVTKLEVTVSGKSREESLGWVLPAGFRLASIDSPIPVAVNDSGEMQAQVRAGKWIITMLAFRVQNDSEFRFAEGAQPRNQQELIAFRAKPEFRLAELSGLQSMDVSQTTFPKEWRQLPVYQWDTETPFQLVEKVRGMGLQRPAGLSVQRRFWLDENGQSLTYQDVVTGAMQQVWRLDVADRQELGAVRIDDEAQLITENPDTGAQGVELRKRNVQLKAMGRVNGIEEIAATGWQADVESLEATFVLPPGWRAFALFGVDQVSGDWLTAWSLLDLFLLLVFTIAVGRVWGVLPGLIAFVGFGLAYHEPGSPRLTWLFLLIPLALLKVVPTGAIQRVVTIWKYFALTLLVLCLVPFLAAQLQTVIYPQLETPGINYSSRRMVGTVGSAYQLATQVADEVSYSRKVDADQRAQAGAPSKKLKTAKNLAFDPQARIQTGPAEPQWSWNLVRCRWNGPVAAGQKIRPILIPSSVHRLLTVLRVLFLIALATVMLWTRSLRFRLPRSAPTVAALALLLIGLNATASRADDFPDPRLLEELRQRIQEPIVEMPTVADIASADLAIEGNQVRMAVEIHATDEVAVPLPGKLSSWSPLKITIGGKPAKQVTRYNGFLWVVVPPGVHQVVLESMLVEAAEWDWSFALKPRRVTVNAPGWEVSGLDSNGVPGQQLFFSRQRQPEQGEAAYDQTEFNPIVAVDRHLEIGLIWQVRTVVSRLSPGGKGTTIQVPLLDGERVLSPGWEAEQGLMTVTLGGGQAAQSWTSVLPVGDAVQLATRSDDTWVERWHMVASPVWNVTRGGLEPVFEAQQRDMVPVWHPWPGESARLSFSKPKPVVGAVVTVQSVQQQVSLGRRQRDVVLKLEVECSLGNDFVVELSPDAVVQSVKHDGAAIPVRRNDDGLVVPLRPGRQPVEVVWKINQPIGVVTKTEPITLPVEGSNSVTSVAVPESRWVLWTEGPLRGPAVRFWVVLLCSLVLAFILGAVPGSPLKRYEWVLLSIGMTQVPIVSAIVVVIWLFMLVWRGQIDTDVHRPFIVNTAQVLLAFLTLVVLGVLVAIVGAGLLGSPDMFVIGNQSSERFLKWFQPRVDAELPVASLISVPVWYYRVLMLLWALWLAASVVRWLKWAWQQYSHGGLWFRKSEFVTAVVADD